MSNQFKTPQFKRLQRDWNEKLAKSGFVDIENSSLPGGPDLKWYDALKFDTKRTPKEIADSTRDYFLWAESRLEHFKFKLEIHKKIWSMHSDGKSLREIERNIEQKKFKKSNIFLLIRKLRKEMIWTQARELLDENQD